MSWHQHRQRISEGRVSCQKDCKGRKGWSEWDVFIYGFRHRKSSPAITRIRVCLGSRVAEGGEIRLLGTWRTVHMDVNVIQVGGKSLSQVSKCSVNGYSGQRSNK